MSASMNPGYSVTRDEGRRSWSILDPQGREVHVHELFQTKREALGYLCIHDIAAEQEEERQRNAEAVARNARIAAEQRHPLWPLGNAYRVYSEDLAALARRIDRDEGRFPNTPGLEKLRTSIAELALKASQEARDVWTLVHLEMVS